ncbi:MAG: glycosyltransferase family 39 protein [Aquabacterium sp.]|nr:glycosyltransferase family 39 protein [Aquabacterium sp.]
MNQPTNALVVSTGAAPVAKRPPTQRWPKIWGPRMWKLLALVAVLFVYRLWVVKHSGISLFFDEAQYWDWSKHLAWGYFSKPPLIAGLIWLSTALFGSGVLGVKAIVMLLYPATALSMVGLARALWPTSSGVRTGMVAGALFMTIPMVGLMGMFASTDAPLILCWTLASWALWRAQVTNRMSHWALLGVVCGIGLMGKYTMAAFALTAVWTLWAVHGPERGVFRLGPWLAAAIALALLSPNLIWNAQNGFPTMQHTVELTAQSDRSGGGAQLGLLPGIGVELPLLVGHEPAAADRGHCAGPVCRCARELGRAVHGGFHAADRLAPEPTAGAPGLAPPDWLAGCRAGIQPRVDVRHAAPA